MNVHDITPGSREKIRIAILTAASLAWNPRALREAQTLARADFDVVVYGAGSNQDQIKADESLARRHDFAFKSILPVGQGLLLRMGTIGRRIRVRIGGVLTRTLGVESRWQLGAAAELLRHAKKAHADYYIAHLEPAAWVGVQLLSAGLQVGVDMEDWYSEDLLPEARKSRPIRLLRELEHRLLTDGAHATCPSAAMSKVLREEYGCVAPLAVYNVDLWGGRETIDGLSRDRMSRTRPSIHWFSQTLGRGRGLEDLLEALPLVKYEAEVHLRGHPADGFLEWLALAVPEKWRGRVFVHGLVSENELLSRVAEHDVGFAGEMKYCRSRDLTVTNKILQYLLAGLAVVASDTTGQREVAIQAPGAVSLYASGDFAALAARLNALLASPELLSGAKTAALRAAERTFCWEHQERKLVEAVSYAIAARERN
jgi:glycosyltransferase involved in cell wall biosynthesis